MNHNSNTDSGSRSFGVVLICIGALAILFSMDISHTGLGNNHDPGPRAFPISLGICLILGGVYELARWLVKRGKADAGARKCSWLSEVKSVLLDARNTDALILVVGLCVYIPAISWLGFSLSTLLFAAGLMMRLGARWALAAAMSLVLVITINLLFVVLFRVQLPTGALGLPF